MMPKARIFQISFELWNFMIVWGITNSGEFLLNPPQLSRRLNRYSIRLTFLPETLPNCHKRFTISLLEIHIGFQCQESSYAFAYESLFLFPEILRDFLEFTAAGYIKWISGSGLWVRAHLKNSTTCQRLRVAD